MYIDPFAQTNPWAAIASQLQGSSPFGASQQINPYAQYGLGQQSGGLGWPGTQMGGSPQNLSQLLPQTWLGALYGAQHPMHQYAQQPGLLQQGLYGSPMLQQGLPFGQTGFGSPFGQTGFGGSPFGQIGSPLAQLNPQILQTLLHTLLAATQPGLGQTIGRPPFGFGNYPFA